MATPVQVVLDCLDPVRVCEFWQQPLGYELEWEWDEETTRWMRDGGLPDEMVGSRMACRGPDGAGPRLFFQRVPEEKVVRNRARLGVGGRPAVTVAGVRKERPRSFLLELGFEVESDESGVWRGRAPIIPGVCLPDTDVVLSSVLLTYADVLAGPLANQATLPRACMTVDLNVRLLRRPPADGLEAEGRVLKSGRTLTFTEVVFRPAGGGEPFATSLGTFVASPRPEDTLEGWDDVPEFRGRPTLDVPLHERVGARIVEPGVVEVARAPELLNPADTVQGGIIALVGELAALSVADGIVRELDVRYMRATRVGPARAVAERLSPRTTRVEVRDAGDGDRLGAVVHVTTAPTW